MKVKNLIKQLKGMPPNLDVFYAHQDNYEWETAGSVNSVNHCKKCCLQDLLDATTPYESDRERFDHNPDEWVCIRD